MNKSTLSMMSKSLMNAKNALFTLLIAFTGLLPMAASAQTNFTENFTGNSTTNSWTFLNGACLTAGTSTSTTTTNPGCVGLQYYINKEGASPSFLGGNGPTLPATSFSFPDPVNGGAVRFTNLGNESGAILSTFNYPLSTEGLQVSFTTVTYDGNGGGTGGADGISFFLQDASYPADVGAFGGSLAYTCSNANNDGTINPITTLARGYDGIQGGYIGLGIDEFGNFLNGVTNTLGTSTGATGDNTASGGGYQPGRIGLRGSGSITWASLNAQYPLYYPSTLNESARTQSVQQACRTGLVSNWSSGSQVALSTVTPITIRPPNAASYTAPAVAPAYGDYFAVPGGFKVLPSSQPIANGQAPGAPIYRSAAIPITYNLKITPAGLLSLSYSYNGGANQSVITGVDITQKNSMGIAANPLPASVRFGFAGSTGGSRNVHEIMCFQATPSNTSSSSAGLNQKQTAKVQTGTQVYFAFYNPQTLAGSVTSQYLAADASNNLIISPTINWDGSCVLTGVATGSNCDTTGPAGTGSPLSPPASRVIFSWNYNTTTATGPGTPIPFEWANLSSSAQGLLDTGDTAPLNSSRLDYLRGNRGTPTAPLEQIPTSTTTFIGNFRARASVLGDIVDSSPTWVGPPQAGFPNSWADLIHASGACGTCDPMNENSGESYGTFAATAGAPAATGFQPVEQTRTNVVYVGANDGMLHGFRSGNFNASNVFDQTNNDGKEVMAYVPGQIVQTIQGATAARNFSDPQYGHKFQVDAAPATGDVFYSGVWHTWLVGGLGPGGKAIYALDVTDPDTNFSSESNAATVVKGEWSNTSITCANSTTCGASLGNTYGTPVIRRLHNGNWAAIFGNGFGSSNGDAGIFIMLIDSGGNTTFRYLSTGIGSGTPPSSTANGIAYVSAVDLDADRITDYVYAGDLLGNVWRFDLTSNLPSAWAVTPNPIFSSPGQAITSAPVVVATPGTGNAPHVMVEFGTGRQVPQSLISAATYQTSQQAIYGIWDWNMASWNLLSSTKFAVPFTARSLPTGRNPLVSGTTSLVQQVINAPTAATTANTGSDYRTVTANAVCFGDASGCSSNGWYMNLVSGFPNAADPAVPQATAAVPSATMLYEQVVFNPVLVLGALVVNTTIPPQASATSCYSAAASGWTMAIDPATGGSFASSFFEDGTANHNVLSVNGSSGNVAVSGLALGGTGSFSTVQYQTQYYGITQTTTSPFIGAINPPGNLKGKRVTWIQKR
jgi:type IV pilus assembly protein PilY1